MIFLGDHSSGAEMGKVTVRAYVEVLSDVVGKPWKTSVTIARSGARTRVSKHCRSKVSNVTDWGTGP